MEVVLIWIASGCLGWIISEGSGLVQQFKFRFDIARLKPFDCPLCLSFWIGILLFILSGTDWYLIIPYAGVSSFLGLYISKRMNS